MVGLPPEFSPSGPSTNGDCMNYYEKLKDPRWQKKRLEVLEFADWSCELCGDSESELHVHHKQYIKGREPWEYDVQQLVSLCKSCHAERHALGSDFLTIVTSYANYCGSRDRDACAHLLAGFLRLYVPLEGLPQYLKEAYQRGAEI